MKSTTNKLNHVESSSSSTTITGEIAFSIPLPPILSRLMTASLNINDNYRIRKAVERDVAAALSYCSSLHIYHDEEIIGTSEEEEHQHEAATNTNEQNATVTKKVVTKHSSGIKRIVARELRDRNDWIEISVVTVTKKIAFAVKKFISEQWLSGFVGTDAKMNETIKLLVTEAAAVTEVNKEELDMLRFANLRDLKVRTVDLNPTLKIVRKGDLLKTVAISNGIGIDALIAANPEAIQALLAQDFELDRRPLAGEKILIPKDNSSNQNFWASRIAGANTNNNSNNNIDTNLGIGGGGTGVIQSEKVIETVAGDTLVDIANRQNCNLRLLKKLNIAVLPLFGVVHLLRIPTTTSSTMMKTLIRNTSSSIESSQQLPASSSSTANTTMVRSMADGETVVAVALRFGADVDELYIHTDDLYVPKKASVRLPPSVGGLIPSVNRDDYDSYSTQLDEIPFCIKNTDVVVIEDTNAASSPLSSIAARWGISVRELTLYNASVIRVRRGAFITIVLNHINNETKKSSATNENNQTAGEENDNNGNFSNTGHRLPRVEIDLVALSERAQNLHSSPASSINRASIDTASSNSSQQRKLMKQNPLGTAGQELILNCQVRPMDTIQSLAAQYDQSVTAILDMNPEVAEHSGALVILVPVAEENINDVLVCQPPHLFAVVPHKPDETLQLVCKRFAVPFGRANDANLMLPEETRQSNWLIPVASATAAALCRQMGHPLYFLLQPNRGESLAKMSERCLGSAGFSDQLIPIGKPLGSLGIHNVQVPIASATARTMLANNEAYLVVHDENSAQQHQLLTALPEVPLSLRFTQTAFIEARERALEARKTQLEDRAKELDRVLGQVSSRIDATEREFGTVSKLRDDMLRKMLEQEEKERLANENAEGSDDIKNGGKKMDNARLKKFADAFSSPLFNKSVMNIGGKSNNSGNNGGGFGNSDISCQTDTIHLIIDPRKPNPIFTFSSKVSLNDTSNSLLYAANTVDVAAQTIGIAAYQNTSVAEEHAANMRKMIRLEKEVESLQSELSSAIDELTGYKNHPGLYSKDGSILGRSGAGLSHRAGGRSSSSNNHHDENGASEATQIEMEGKNDQIKALQEENQQLHAALTDAFETSITGGNSQNKGGKSFNSNPIARRRALIATKAKCATVKQSCRDLKILVIRLFGGAVDQLQDAAAEAGTGELEGLADFFATSIKIRKSSNNSSRAPRFKVRDSEQSAVDALLRDQHDIAAPLGRTRSMPCMRSIFFGANENDPNKENLLDIPASRIVRPEDWMMRQVHDYVVGQVSKENTDPNKNNSPSISISRQQLQGQVVAPGRTWVPSARPTLKTGDDVLIKGSSFRLADRNNSNSISPRRNENGDPLSNDLKYLQEQVMSTNSKNHIDGIDTLPDDQDDLNNASKNGKKNKSGLTPQRRLYEKFMEENNNNNNNSSKNNNNSSSSNRPIFASSMNPENALKEQAQVSTRSRQEQLKRFVPMLQLIRSLQSNQAASASLREQNDPSKSQSNIVISTASTSLSPLTLEGRAQIERARMEDEQLRKETMSIAWRQMTTRIQIKKAKLRMEDLSLPLQDRRSMNQLVQLWKNWMARWNSRRKTILVERRSNIEDLVGQFVASNKQNQNQLLVRGNTNQFTRADLPPNYSSAQLQSMSNMIQFNPRRPYPSQNQLPNMQVTSYQQQQQQQQQFQGRHQFLATNNTNQRTAGSKMFSTSTMSQSQLRSPVPPPSSSVRHGHTYLRSFDVPPISGTDGGLLSFKQSSPNKKFDVPVQNYSSSPKNYDKKANSSRHFDDVQLPNDANNNKTKSKDVPEQQPEKEKEQQNIQVTVG